MKFLFNHLGYQPDQTKKALFQGDLGQSREFHILNPLGQICWTGTLRPTPAPGEWGEYALADFSPWRTPGQWRLSGAGVQSELFEIAEDLHSRECLSDLLFYFKSQRCSGIFDRSDRRAKFADGLRRETVDVHGGWYDASGDVSKYLSHLSYANTMNPQQSPLLCWTLLYGYGILSQRTGQPWLNLSQRMLEEALYGADFLVRMQDPQGYFYQCLFDQWSKDPKQREICSFSTRNGVKSEMFQASFRSGGGMAVAALARAARLGVRGEFAPEVYAEKAEVGYDHLRNYGFQYNPDGQDNVIDEYCALLAAVELYRLTRDDHYRKDASIWAHALVERQRSDTQWDGWLQVGDGEEMPFYHASDAALPWIALEEYLQIETDPMEAASVEQALQRAWAMELGICTEVDNPFGLARQYVQGTQSPRRSSFFIPHDNPSGYWWQGENARLASLAVGALGAAQGSQKEWASDLQIFAWDQIHWILGCNPFDACMLHRHGRNNPRYEVGYPNAPGGVCNGITSRWVDGRGIQLGPQSEVEDSPGERWRWGEQWLPHGAWLTLALCRALA